MKFRIIIQSVLVGAAIFVPTFLGQSLDELKTRYPTEGIFKIRPNVLMTPYYGSKGNLCGVYLQANRFPDLPHSISGGIIEGFDVESIVQELEPKETKNKIGQAYYFKRSAELSIASFSYDDLSVYLTAHAMPMASGKQAGGETSFKSTLSDFLASFGAAEVARVWWIRRDGCHDR